VVDHQGALAWREQLREPHLGRGPAGFGLLEDIVLRNDSPGWQVAAGLGDRFAHPAQLSFLLKQPVSGCSVLMRLSWKRNAHTHSFRRLFSPMETCRSIRHLVPKSNGFPADLTPISWRGELSSQDGSNNAVCTRRATDSSQINSSLT